MITYFSEISFYVVGNLRTINTIDIPGFCVSEFADRTIADVNATTIGVIKCITISDKKYFLHVDFIDESSKSFWGGLSICAFSLTNLVVRDIIPFYEAIYGWIHARIKYRRSS